MTHDNQSTDSMRPGAPHIRLPLRLGLAATAAATVDLALAWSYWSPHGATVAKLLHAQARWVLGPHAMRSAQTVGIGLATGWMLYLLAAVGVMIALRRGDGQRAARPSRWRGVIVGVTVYVVLFQILVPWLAFPVVPDRSPGWIGACLVTHAALIGPLLVALLAPSVAWHERSAHDRRRMLARFSRRRASPRTPA